jgi:MFS-type transporter involved in bile tolerance (Atg22 family)
LAPPQRVGCFSSSVTGSSRNAILSVVVRFIVGAAVLAFVDVEKGRTAARDAEAGVRLVPAE